ncbi:histone H3-K4 methyltransferase Set1 [Dipodascopsis uninucleata]
MNNTLSSTIGSSSQLSPGNHQSSPRYDGERSNIRSGYSNTDKNNDNYGKNSDRNVNKDTADSHTNGDVISDSSKDGIDSVLSLLGRSYQIEYDPDLDKTKSRGKQPIYRKTMGSGSSRVYDPRNLIKDYPRSRERKSKRKLFLSTLNLLKYAFDSSSIGPRPPSQIFVWGFSPLVTDSNVAVQFKEYGEFDKFSMQKDPTTGVSLGMCLIRYKSTDKLFTKKTGGDNVMGHIAAKKAVEAAKSGRIKIGFDSVSVEFDDNGILCSKKVEEAVRLRESSRTINPPPPPPLSASVSYEKRSNSPLSRTSRSPTRGRSNSRLARRWSPSHSRSRSRSRSRSLTPYSSDSRSHSRERHYHSSDDNSYYGGSSRHITRKYSNSVLSRIDGRPYIFISDRYVSTTQVYVSDMKDYLRSYDWVSVFANERPGFYIVFESAKEARACFLDLDGRMMGRLRYRLNMDLHIPRSAGDMSDDSADDTEIDPVKDATVAIMKELQEALRKDIKERITVPVIYDRLDPAKLAAVSKDSKSREKPASSTEVSSESTTTSDGKIVSIYNDINEIPTIHTFSGTLPSLPRFKKRNLTSGPERSKYKSSSDHNARARLSRPMNHQLNDYFSDDDIQEFGDDEAAAASQKNLKEPSLRADYSDDEKDFPIKSENHENENFANAEVIKYDKSEVEKMFSDEDSTIDGLKEDVAMKDVDSELLKSTDSQDDIKKRKRKSDVKKRKKKLVKIDFTTSEEDEAEDTKLKMKKDDLEDNLQLPTPSDEDFDMSTVDDSYWKPNTVIDQSTFESDTVLDLDGIQNLVSDNEDFKLLQAALRDVVSSTNIEDVNYWSYLHKLRKANFFDNVYRGAVKKQVYVDDEYNGTNSTGSARTEGYYRIPETEKTEYLEHRKRLRKKKHAEAASEIEKDSTSSRLNRINNRRLVADINLQKQILSNETDVLRFNQLKKRKKPVRFARSAIHNWGLYAMENIAANDMIIEYVGEVIRQPVADMRERRYLKNGIGSSYLFRIDESTVVDATKRGGIARFINHCCTPSCTAKIIKVEGQKRIVIYALRDIQANEELTYDYKFEREVNSDERIPCLCGSAGCKGFLN